MADSDGHGKTAVEALVDRIAALENAVIDIANAVRTALPHTTPQIDRALMDWRVKLVQITEEAQGED